MSKPNRGRLQAQSDHIEESVPWAQEEPPSLQQGMDMMQELKGKLSKKEQKKRKAQFKQLERFMKNAADSGGIYSPEFRSFGNPDQKDGTRVDFELWAGAFGLTVIVFLIIILL